MLNHSLFFKYCFGLVLILLSMYVSGAQESMQPINPSLSFKLSSKQIDDYKLMALHGDMNAAYKLYKYYSMLTKNKYEYHAWLYVSAALGHEIADRNYKKLVKRSVITPSTIFIMSPDQLSKYESKLSSGNNEIWRIYFIYMHYLQDGKDNEAAKYYKQLVSKEVSKKIIALPSVSSEE